MATPLTFGNHLKFGQGSYHNAKGRPTFLHRERATEAPCEPYTFIERGLQRALRVCMLSPRRMVERRPMVVAVFLLPRLRPSVDKRQTSTAEHWMHYSVRWLMRSSRRYPQSKLLRKHGLSSRQPMKVLRLSRIQNSKGSLLALKRQKWKRMSYLMSSMSS